MFCQVVKKILNIIKVKIDSQNNLREANKSSKTKYCQYKVPNDERNSKLKGLTVAHQTLQKSHKYVVKERNCDRVIPIPLEKNFVIG